MFVWPRHRKKKCSKLNEPVFESWSRPWRDKVMVRATRLGCGKIYMVFWPQEIVMINLVPFWPLWKISPGLQQCWKGNLLIMLSLILMKQQTFIAVCRAHASKFNIWTETLIFICSSKDQS